jgi:hypothetical protein
MVIGPNQPHCARPELDLRGAPLALVTLRRRGDRGVVEGRDAPVSTVLLENPDAELVVRGGR